MNDIREIFKIIPKKIWIGFVAVIVIMVGIIILTSIKPKNGSISSSLINIENKEILKSIPEEELNDFKDSLHAVLENDVGVDKDQKIEVSEIRNYEDGSSEGQGGVEIKSAKFLVDIDDYQRTYKVIIAWVPGDKTYPLPVNPVIKCPEPSESKWPEAKCKTYTSSYKDFDNSKQEEDGNK